MNRIENLNFTKYIVAIAFVSFILNFIFVQPFYSQSYTVKTLVIDAGHGGKDPGALGKRSYEKDIALKIALKLGEYIKENMPDVNIIYTRKTDIFVELDERADIANRNKADLFISLHMNSNVNKDPFGTSTYVMGMHKAEDNFDVAKRENTVIMYEKDYTLKYEGFDPESPESFIIFSLMQQQFLEQSLDFAGEIQKQFKVRAGRHDRGVHQAGILVLWKTGMPSVLVECGFISNPVEEKYLMTEYGQSIIASAIFRAFRDYKSQIDSKNNFKTGLPKNNVVRKTESSKKPTESNNSKTVEISETDIVYKIQVASSAKPFDPKHKYYKLFTDLEEIKIDNGYKYYTGSTYNYSKITALLSSVQKNISDAFIVAYKNGTKISVNEARKFQKK